MMKKSAWITDWAFIVAKEKYIVCPINSSDGRFYLGQPSGIFLGWQVQRLMEKCYAALPMPEFDPSFIDGKAAIA